VLAGNGRMCNSRPIIIANIDFSLMAMDRRQKTEGRRQISDL